jgi:hypothetical protein
MAERIMISDYQLFPRQCTDENCPRKETLPNGKESTSYCIHPTFCPEYDFERCIGESEDFEGMPVTVPGTDGRKNLVQKIKHYLVDKEHPVTENLMSARVYQVEEVRALGQGKFYVEASRERDLTLVGIVATAWQKRHTDFI